MTFELCESVEIKISEKTDSQRLKSRFSSEASFLEMSRWRGG